MNEASLNSELEILGTMRQNANQFAAQNEYWMNLVARVQKQDENLYDDDDSAYPGVFENSGLEKIEIPGNVKVLSRACFRNCTALKNAILHEGLKIIGERCFRGAGLVSVEVPASVERIGLKAFSRTFRLRDFRLVPGPAQVRLEEFVLQLSAVRDCDLGDRVQVLPRGMFWGCRGIHNFSLPEKLQKIASACFRDSDVMHLQIPASVEEIGDYAFQNCVYLREVAFSLGSALKRIGAGAFERTALENFVAPMSLRNIGSGAFYRCDKLRTVVLNEGLLQFGEEYSTALHGMFQESSVESVVLPGSLRVLAPGTFAGC